MPGAAPRAARRGPTTLLRTLHALGSTMRDLGAGVDLPAGMAEVERELQRDRGWGGPYTRADAAPAAERVAERTSMRLLIAILLPWLGFFTIGRPFAGIVCLVLQVTLIGWLPAAIWAVYALSQYKTDKKIEAALGRRG